MPLQEEQLIQITLMRWIKLKYPAAEQDTYHFANERKCTVRYGHILKLMGVKRGVSDLFISIPRNGKSGLWLEIKVGDKKPTKEQIAFLERQSKNGYAVAWVNGLQEAKDVISNYLKD